MGLEGTLFKKIMLASLAAGALALNAPAAQADPPVYDCGYRSLQALDAQTYEGTAEGVVAHPGDTTAEVRCIVTVNGNDVAATPWGNPSVGTVSYSANDGDTVQLCAEARTNHGTHERLCGTAESQEIPPPVVWDTLNAIVIGYVDPAVCPALAAAAGDYAGTVVVNNQGDIYVAGEPQWDCPPYDIWPPA